ncbi:FecCD family ABC transporter permease [Pseudomonas matsuisoli]|uniref:ABC transporter permease n=1 Tax=Pseudomonas matsuisoli TaxID=1515666 RepID=A0A917PUV2_9PSED|nr:iron chelate uptake ABC transporter family permease subunit [Pseudomonas matsuisoli]GGJ93053.1 ABC transporter permease [Pseudomonas matsuisoli]
MSRPISRLGLLARLIGSVTILAIAVLAGIAIGETAIEPSIVLQTLANKLWTAGYGLDPIDEGIVWSYRLPRTLVAGACGAGLAICGLILQALLRNPLAEPYLLGISAGASTGAVLIAVIGVGGGLISLPVGAFAGAVVAFGLVAILARTSRGASASSQIILAGIAGSQLFNALTAYLITKSASAEQARGIMFWLLGNLSGVRWSSVWMAIPAVAIALLVCFWYRRALDAFTFGSDSAASLGIPVRQTRTVLIACAAFVTAIMVSIVGSIGFVGLVIPHAVRLLVGSRHTRLVPTSALVGALFLISADILSRILIKGQVLPIGVITALIGAPVFALLLIRGARVR